MEKLKRFYLEMTRSQKRDLHRIALGAACFVLSILLTRFIPLFSGFLGLIFFVPTWLILGFGVLKDALYGIKNRQIFDENFLMTIASIGAFFTGEYHEAVAVMLFFQVGELFEHLAVARSRKSITELMDLCPDVAHLKTEDGIEDADPYDIEEGSIIVIRPGERIPLDGVVVRGVSTLDTSALTGEPVPRSVTVGSEALSGCINGAGLLELRTSGGYEESTVARIMELVENAAARKAKTEAFITRFSRIYTPAVVGAAVLLALLPPIFTGQPFSEWIHRALMFLVVSCPCALVISVPMSFFGGIGGASRKGILMKGSNSLETLAKVGSVLMDKTGTLTKGSFSVTEIRPCGETDGDALIKLAAMAEHYSSHPISQSLRTAYGQPVDESRIKDYSEIAGQGVAARIDGRAVLCGNEKLMKENGIAAALPETSGTVVHLAEEGVYLGYIVIADEIKPTAKAAVMGLKKLGLRTVMLTGDSEASARPVADTLGIHTLHAGLLPQDKVTCCENEMVLAEKAGKKTLFVGDGINDAPVLMLSDVGAAMGGLGSDAAIEAADLVLMDDNPEKLVTAVLIARKTVSIVWQNIIFALGIKIAILILSALGLTGMWLAVFADVGVAMLAILNAMRAGRV